MPGTALPPFSSAPVVVGHRGAPRCAAENTPASFAAAAAAGARWVELDARLSAEGVVVVVHDPVTVDGAVVGATDVAELRQRGVWTLADVLDRLPMGLGVDVEAKNFPGEPDYDEEGVRLPDALAEVLGGVRDRPLLVTSFNPATIVALADRLPSMAIGLLTSDGLAAEAGSALARELGAQVWAPHVHTPRLDAAIPSALDGGMQVLVWTVNDPDRAHTLADSGAHALCTDDPAGLVAALPS